MTRMSEYHVRYDRTSDRNRWQSWAGSTLARTVHTPCVVLRIVVSNLWMTMLVGCLIPPSLEVENQDASVNSPPAILGVTSDNQALSEPGPVLFDMGSTAGDISLSLIDTDTHDTLFVRIFVDYNSPNRLDARARCTAPPSTSAGRTATCKLNSLCLMEDLGVQRNMTIVVFDRDPLPPGDGDPPFQAMPAGGLSTSRFYFLKCQPPQT